MRDTIVKEKHYTVLEWLDFLFTAKKTEIQQNLFWDSKEECKTFVLRYLLKSNECLFLYTRQLKALEQFEAKLMYISFQ